MTFGERLKTELKNQGLSIRGLHKHLEEKKVRGYAYSSVWSYIKDEVKPPLEFVRATASRLGVREEWLEKGQLPRTDREELFYKVSDDPELSRFSKAFLALEEIQSRLPWSGHLSPLERTAWEELAVRLLDAGPDRRFEDYDHDEMAAALEPLAWLLWLPIMALRPGEFEIPADVARNYFMAMYQALSLAMPAEGEGHTDSSVRFLGQVQEAVQARTTVLASDTGLGSE